MPANSSTTNHCTSFFFFFSRFSLQVLISSSLLLSLAYGIGLAFFTLGVVGCLGSDDVLAAFVAGNRLVIPRSTSPSRWMLTLVGGSLTWQDFYRIESEDDTFQDVIDGLLNASIFIYIGTLFVLFFFRAQNAPD